MYIYIFCSTHYFLGRTNNFGLRLTSGMLKGNDYYFIHFGGPAKKAYFR